MSCWCHFVVFRGGETWIVICIVSCVFWEVREDAQTSIVAFGIWKGSLGAAAQIVKACIHICAWYKEHLRCLDPFERKRREKRTWLHYSLVVLRRFHIYSFDRGSEKDMAGCWFYFGQKKSKHRLSVHVFWTEEKKKPMQVLLRCFEKRRRHPLTLYRFLERREADNTLPRDDFGKKRHDLSWCVFMDRRESDMTSWARILERREETAHGRLLWCFEKMRRSRALR